MVQSLGPFLKLELELENFPDKSLFFVACQETRKRFFIVTYCSRPDLSRFLFLPLRSFLSALSTHPCFLSFSLFLSRFRSRTPTTTRPPLDCRYSRGSFLAFEIAVSIRNVMERGVSFSFRLLLSPLAGFHAMQHVSPLGDSIERDRTVVF